jgi:hypothetical protein
MKQKSTYHEKLRDTYSRLLREALFSDRDLHKLSEHDIQLLFEELTKWFGTSPPDTSRVMEDLREIIEEEIDLSNLDTESD